MKDQKSYQNTTIYTIYGILLGLAFVATLFEISLQGLSFSIDTVTKVQVGNPLLWIIDTAPFFLGLMAGLAGYLKDQTVHINQGLERTIHERTEVLRNRNKELIEAKEQAEAGAKAKTQFLSTRVQQVLVNLVRNAIKFTEEGEVVIFVKKIRDEEGYINLQFAVKDTGIGIPKK